MYNPVQNTNGPYWDNSKLIQEIGILFNQGEEYYNMGKDRNLKEKGLSLLYQGLNKLKILIDRSNPTDKLRYQKILEEKMKQYDQKYEYLKTYDTKSSKQEAALVTGGGNNNDKSEDSKFKSALEQEIVTEKPNIKWTDIAGLEVAKKSLQEAVILPMRFPQIFDEVRKPWKGILLYGPPGTGKTFLAKACATEAQATFFSISSSSLVSKYVGETEKMIKALFNLAREKKPSIIFIDECDSLFTARSDNENEASRRAKTEFLTQMQGVGRDDKGILVLGATNIPWSLDSAIRRRFEKRIYIPLPDVESRKYQISLNLKKTNHTLSEKDIQDFAYKTDGFSGSDIAVLIKDAVMEPVRLLQATNKFQKVIINNKVKYIPVQSNSNGPDIVSMTMNDIKNDELEMPKVNRADFDKSKINCKPSVNKALIGEFEKWTKEFGQDG